MHDVPVRQGTLVQPLAALAPGAVALSVPLLAAAPPGASLAPDPAAAFAAMLPTDTIARGPPLDLYWETYGVAATDTVQHAILIQRVTPQSVERRLAIRLGMTADRNTPVAVVWAEAGLGSGAVLIPDGPVPVAGRTMRLATTGLPSGTYRLEVAVLRAGDPPVRVDRRLVVR